METSSRTFGAPSDTWYIWRHGLSLGFPWNEEQYGARILWIILAIFFLGLPLAGNSGFWEGIPSANAQTHTYMFICMCKKYKEGFLPRNAQASGRATRYWSGCLWSWGWFRAWGEPKHCSGFKDGIPRKLTNEIRKTCSVFLCFPWIPKELRSGSWVFKNPQFEPG